MAFAPEDPHPRIAGRDPGSEEAHGPNSDPRLLRVEPMLRSGDWDSVLSTLASEQQRGPIPASVGLLYAIALKEKDRVSDPGAADATSLAIRSTAELLGVAGDSALALVIAKRILRKNPVSWQKRAAPPARVSMLIVLAAIAVGSAIGWLIATGRIRFYF